MSLLLTKFDLVQSCYKYFMFGFFQTVYMSVDKLNRFTNTSLMPPEQHFYPAALAFSKSTVLFNQELFDLLLLHK